MKPITIISAIVFTGVLSAQATIAQDEHPQPSTAQPFVRVTRPVTDVPAEPNKALARAELDRLIRELQSISFPDPTNPANASRTAAQQGSHDKHAGDGKSELVGDASDANPSPARTAADSNEPSRSGSRLVAEPNSVANPLELAEALYKVARYDEAAACYQVALDRVASGQNKSATARDQAWILFQIGNCHARMNPEAAINAYKRLIADHPASDWTPIAVVREQLMQWYLASGIPVTKEKPRLEKRR